jgi:electron transfer flavoprotein alpha subunit
MATPVVVCTWGAGPDGLPSGIDELLTLGRTVSAALNGPLHWLTLGAAPARAGAVAAQFGAAGVDRVADGKLESFSADAYVAALAQYCVQVTPRVVLFSQTFEARLVVPRLAGRLGAAVVMNATDLAVGGDTVRVTAAAYGGDTRVVYELRGAGPCLASVMPNAVAPAPLDRPAADLPVRDVAVDLSTVTERVRVVSRAQTTGPRLEDAQIIVAGGRGLGSKEKYQLVEDLARALGGMAGASRPIVDDGWTEASRQVGLTGKITRPALYVAAGISGASQHMAGCAASKNLVAINRDPDAPIFRYARYGLVGDCLEILPELIRAAKGA